MKTFSTYSQKPADISRKWYVIDASKAPLGRIATLTANFLIGKSKPTFTPHVDNGDYVIVINADKLVVTGDKENSKKYHNYSGFPGGLKTASLSEVRSKYPERIISEAVRGMLPKNKLSNARLERLKVYSGDQHLHNAQSPVEIEVK